MSSLRRFSKKISKYILIFFLSVLVFISFLFFNSFFKINSIEVEGEKNIKLNGLSTLIGENLILLNEKEIEDLLVSKNTEVKALNIEKSLPNKLKINIKFSDPLALFKVNGGYFILNDAARIIAKNRNPDISLPIIKYYQQFDFTYLRIGDKLDYKDIVISLEIIKTFLNLGMKPDNVDIKDTNMISSSIGDKKILFTTDKDLNKQQEELAIIIKQFKIQGKDYKVLDLRFEKPVVKF